ncbi:MAG: hypothetical protein GY947_09460 [Rhodobacteraceae bacterium]|nr:hypothetical protein [Paracoccaceae bacterium]
MQGLIWIELAIVLTMALAACGAIYGSYRRGGKAWDEKFSFTRQKPDGTTQQISGEWGEMIVVAMMFLGYALVLLIAPDYSLLTIDGWHILLLVGMTGVITTWGVLHGKRVVKRSAHRSESFRAELAAGYAYYPFFAITLHLGAFIAAVRIAHRFVDDVQRFFQNATGFLSSHAETIAAAGGKIDLASAVEFERAFYLFNTLNRSVIQQLEPLVIFLSYGMVILMLVAFSPLRHSFHRDARNAGYYMAGGALAIVLIVAMTSYYFQYIYFSEQYQEQLKQVLSFAPEEFDYVVRVSEMLSQLSRFSGFSGFLRIFTEEGGIYIIVLALLQILVSAMSKRSEAK